MVLTPIVIISCNNVRGSASCVLLSDRVPTATSLLPISVNYIDKLLHFYL
jgi:hypothetical protein